MKQVLRFFIRRHLLASLITFTLLAGGFMTAISINKDLYPRVKLNMITIVTVFPGAAADDVELNVTSKIEREIKSVNGIDKTTSISAEDISIIKVKIDENYDNREVDQCLQEIRSAVSRITDFPEDIDGNPVVERVKENLPVLGVGISYSGNYREAREIARSLEKKIIKLPGVAQIYKMGFREREIQIAADSEKLYQYEIPVTELARAVKLRNIHLSSGTIESFTSESDIVTISKFKDPKDVGNVIVRKSYGASPVYLHQLATITDGFKKEKVLTRLNTKPVIYFDIKKKEDADIIKTVGEVKALLQKESVKLPGSVEILYANDLSRYVSSSFSVVVTNGIAGFILVLVVLTLFLHFRVSIWVALGIPVSLLGAVMLLPAFEVTLDVVTLAAMILTIGLIVDDAIVISENIFQHHEQGDTPVEAAVNGVTSVFWPIITTVLSTLLAFTPMFFIPGDDGKYIFVIPLVITISLLVSMTEGILCLPSHIANDLTRSSAAFDRKTSFKRFISFCTEAYGALLRKLLHYRVIVIGIFIVVFAISMLVASFMKVELFPSEGAEDFAVYVETPAGTRLEVTSRRMMEIEKIITGTMLSKEYLAIISLIGNQEEELNANNIGTIRVNLTPFSKRKRNAVEIVDELRKKCAKLSGFESLYFEIDEGGPNPQKPLSLYVTGTNEIVRKELSNDIYNYLKNHDAVISLKQDFKEGKDTLELVMDYKIMADLQLTVAEVAHVLRISYEGEVVTQNQYNGEEVDFRVRIAGITERAGATLLSLMVPNASGRLIRIGDFASFEKTKGRSTANPYRNERSTNIQADIDKSLTDSHSITDEVILKFSNREKYPGTEIFAEGEAKKTDETMGHFQKAFILAVIGIYFLLVLLFNSFTRPFLVLIAIPFGLSGVIFIFVLHGEPVSFFGTLGIIGLSGVVVNASLILVDNISKKVESFLNGSSHYESALEAVIAGAKERFRAIVMTTITTAAGLIPLAYGIGGSNPSASPMALALGWGVLLSTPLTLILVPSLFVTFALRRTKVSS